jgi:hypothetical protein
MESSYFGRLRQTIGRGSNVLLTAIGLATLAVSVSAYLRFGGWSGYAFGISLLSVALLATGLVQEHEIKKSKAAPLPQIPALHEERLRETAQWLWLQVQIGNKSTVEGDQPRIAAFLTHVPELAQPVEGWNEAIQARSDASAAYKALLAAEVGTRLDSHKFVHETLYPEIETNALAAARSHPVRQRMAFSGLRFAPGNIGPVSFPDGRQIIAADLGEQATADAVNTVHDLLTDAVFWPETQAVITAEESVSAMKQPLMDRLIDVKDHRHDFLTVHPDCVHCPKVSITQ